MARAGETPDDTTPAAVAMVDVFASVGVEAFDVTFTNLAEDPRSYQPNRPAADLRRVIGSAVRNNNRRQFNTIIRPRRGELAEVIQLDDLDAGGAERVKAFAFMLVQTSPGNFQAWVAVKDSVPDFSRRLRKGAGADPNASGATRVSGSRNFKTKYAPAFPSVELAHVAGGAITTTAELERAGLVAPPEPPPAVSVQRAARVRRPGSPRRWPSYELCVQKAPPIHRGERPDISKADFAWCMIAIDWGWGVEDTAARLMEHSTKARENGEGYALLTARKAAEAVARRGSSPKGPPEPR